MAANGAPYGYFFNSENGDRTYDADSFAAWLRPFFTTGVFYGHLQVTANNDMTVTVDTGYCNITGRVRDFSEETECIIETAHSTYDRIDTIVARLDETNRLIEIGVVKGGYSSEPSPTAPVRTGGIYELVLAEVYVAAGATSITQSVITDKRADTDVCGFVVCPIDDFDFDQFATQFDAYLEEFKESSAADFTSWAEAQQEAYEEWIDDAEEAYDTWEAAQQAAFLAWFANIQDVLDSDTAGHLLNMINDTRDGILTQTQNKTTTYNGNTVTDVYSDGHTLITTYSGNTVTEQMYDHNDALQWTKVTTYNGNTVQEVINYE